MRLIKRGRAQPTTIRRGLGIAVAVAVLALLLGGAGHADNLLSNGGFERIDVEATPVGWRFNVLDPAARVTMVVTQRGYKSPNCLLMESHEQLVLFDLYAPPVAMSELGTDNMLFTCYYRTEQQPDAQMSLVTFATDFSEQEWQTPHLQTEAKNIPPSDEWSLLSWQFEALPGAQQVVPILRVTGPGKLYLDNVALRPYPDELSATIVRAGALVEFPDKRRTTVHLTNQSDREHKLQVVLIALDQRGRGKRVEHEVRMKPRGSGTLDLDYALPPDAPHSLQLVVRDTDSGDIYEHKQALAPALIEARFTKPAFRNTLLPSLPTQRLEIAGHINALDNVARSMQLTAEISETGTSATEENGGINRIGPTDFIITMPSADLLSGEYTVVVTATVERANFTQTCQLPLKRLTPSAAEVGYDDYQQLWVNGTPMLPRGLYYVSQPDDLGPISAAGLNFVVVPSTRASYAFAEEARDHGLSLVISSPRILERGGDLEILAVNRSSWENLVRKFASNPVLLGWYVLPRPDQQSIPSEIAAILCQELRGISPAHPTLMALASPSLLSYYSSFPDIVLAWSLPVPQAPITSVARMVDATLEAVAGRKPVWAVIQVAGPAWYRNAALDPSSSGRAPTPAEVRAMTYLALVHGAKGLVYYGYDIPAFPNTKAFKLPQDAPATWERLAAINRELQWLAPVILQGERRLLPTASKGDLHLGLWQYDGGNYVVAVNTSDRGVVADFRLPDIEARQLSVMFEHRLLTRSDGAFQDSFAPHDVHIYAAR